MNYESTKGCYESNNEFDFNRFSDEDAAIAALTEEHYLLGGTSEELEKGVLEEIIKAVKECAGENKSKKSLSGILSLIVF